MKFVKWFFKSLFIAIILIFATNLIGSFININVPVNIWNILIITFLRIPGIIIIIIILLL